MRFSNLYLFISFIGILVALSACSNKVEVNTVRKTGIVMNGNEEVPAVPGAWNGLMDVEYNKDTRVLSYKITWNSLSGVPTAIHLHGTAARGFREMVIDPKNTDIPIQTFSGFTRDVAGAYSGSVFVDGVTLTEESLLAGEYYINIHTALNKEGEIRGQIEF